MEDTIDVELQAIKQLFDDASGGKGDAHSSSRGGGNGGDDSDDDDEGHRKQQAQQLQHLMEEQFGRIRQKLATNLRYQRGHTNKKLKTSNGQQETMSVTNSNNTNTATKVAGVFLLHCGLEYLPNNEELYSSFAKVNRAFRKEVYRVLYERLKVCHPSLIKAGTFSIPHDVGREADISSLWRQWRRFELDEHSSRKFPNSSSNRDTLANLDVLVEVTHGDGNVVFHGIEPLHINSRESKAECTFRVPHWTFGASLPHETDVFGYDDAILEGLQSFYFWSGHEDCSLQQKSLCNAFYGHSSSDLTAPSISNPPIKVQVLLRRRRTGEMVTIISQTDPNQILGEDLGYPVGSYQVDFNTGSGAALFAANNNLYAGLSFPLYCSPDAPLDDGTINAGSTDSNTASITFSSRPGAGQEPHIHEYAEVDFCFGFSDPESYNDIEDVLSVAIQTWHWA